MGLLDSYDVTNAPPIPIARLTWAGPLTVFTSIVAVHSVRLVVLRLPGIRVKSSMFGVTAVTADTAVLCTIAVGAFAVVSAFHDDAIRRFRWIAFGALLASFLPLINAEAGSAATAVGVAAMHVAAYVPCVTLLPWTI
jgi:hypothetical protein